MARRKKIYEGKAKIIYEGPEPGTVVQYFKDDATAFNAQKKDVIEGKGVGPAGGDRAAGSHRAQLCGRHHVKAVGD